MDAVVRTLHEIVTRDPRLLDDGRRLEGLLRDLAPKEQRNIHLLMSAFREGVVKSLRDTSASMPTTMLATQLTQRLEDRLGLSATAADWAVRAWVVALAAQEQPSYTEKPADRTAKWSSYDRLLVTFSADEQGFLADIDLTRNVVDYSIMIPSVDRLAVSPNSSIVYAITTGRDGACNVFHVRSREIVRTIPLDCPKDIALLPSLNRAYVTHTRQNRISIIDTQRNRVVKWIPLRSHSERVIVSPDETRAYVAHSGAEGDGPFLRLLSVIDTASDRVIAVLDMPDMPQDMTIAPDGLTLYALCNDSDLKHILRVKKEVTYSVALLDTKLNAVSAVIPLEGRTFRLAITMHGDWLYGASTELISIIDTRSAALHDSIELGLPGGGDIPVAMSDDLPALYLAHSSDSDNNGSCIAGTGGIRSWNTTTRKLTDQFIRLPGRVLLPNALALIQSTQD
jgi:DNA-binding beta-propeller fold protein YncE